MAVTQIDLDEDALAEVLRRSGRTTKKDAVNDALRDYAAKAHLNDRPRRKRIISPESLAARVPLFLGKAPDARAQLYRHVTDLADLHAAIGGLAAREVTAALSTACAGLSGRDALTALAVALRALLAIQPGAATGHVGFHRWRRCRRGWFRMIMCR